LKFRPLVEAFHLAEHFVGDLFGDFRPDRDDLVVALAVGDRAVLILPFDLDDLVAAPARTRLLGRE
jgi:hypothetical protein